VDKGKHPVEIIFRQTEINQPFRAACKLFYLEWQVIQKDENYKQFSKTELKTPKAFIGL